MAETFIGEIILSSGVLRITIPDRLAKFEGLKVGDIVKVMIKKQDNARQIKTRHNT